MLSYRSKRIISIVALMSVCVLYAGKVANYSNKDSFEAYAATMPYSLSNTVLHISTIENQHATEVTLIEPKEVSTSNKEVSSGSKTNESTKDTAVSSDTDTIYESDVSEKSQDSVIEETSNNAYINFTEDEIYELATLVYLESGIEPYECQLAVASIVLNRMTTTGQSLKDVIYAKNQFSPAYLIESSKPTESTLNAVREVVQNGPTIPEYVTFFRADYYHNWSDLIIPYCVYGNTYFSADARLMGE